MNIVKKILSLFILIVFSCSQTQAFEVTISDDSLSISEKNVQTEGNELEKIQHGKNYKIKIDQFFNEYAGNELALQKLQKRLNTVENKFSTKSSLTYKEKQVKEILDYLIAKNNYHILKSSKNSNLIIDDILSEAEEIIKINFTETINESDKKIAENEILKIQNNLFENGKNLITTLTEGFEEISNYEQTGDIKFEANINFDDKIDIEAKAGFEDYSYKSSGFNSKLTGKIDVLFDSMINGKDIQLSLNGIIDFISKDGNMYLLLEDLKTSGLEESIAYKSLSTALGKLKKEKKYVKFSDENSKMLMKILTNLTPDKIITQGKNIISEPLFKAYTKDGDKFLLLPTKYACDKAKELSNKFDPFNGSSCTQSQYEKFIQELNDNGLSIYLIPGKESELGIYVNENGTSISSNIIFNENYLNELNLSVTPSQVTHPGELFNINYKRKEYLNLYMNADKGDTNYKFNSNLNRHNKFISINYTGTSKSMYSSLDSSLTLLNQNITGKFVSKSKGYDYTTSTYIDKYTTIGTVSGKTSSKGKLNSLDIKIKKIEIANTTNEFSSNLSYNKGNFGIGISSQTQGSKFDLDIDGHWDTSNNILTKLNNNISYLSKEYNFDYSTWKRVYSGELKKVFNSNISLANKRISGKTISYSNGEKLLTVIHSGTFQKNFLDFKNSFDLYKDPSSLYIKTTLHEELKEEDYKANGNFDIYIDTRNKKNNLDMYFNFKVNSEEVIKILLSSDSIIEYKDNIEITEPNDYINAEDLELYPNYNY